MVVLAFSESLLSEIQKSYAGFCKSRFLEVCDKKVFTFPNDSTCVYCFYNKVGTKVYTFPENCTGVNIIPKYGTEVHIYPKWHRDVYFGGVYLYKICTSRATSASAPAPDPPPAAPPTAPPPEPPASSPPTLTFNIEHMKRGKVEATDRPLPAVQHLPPRLRLLHHRLKNHCYIEAIQHFVRGEVTRPLQEGSRWVDATRECRRDTSAGARALS